jgi:site-specific DNA-methyltransferase (adenine-specific)
MKDRNLNHSDNWETPEYLRDEIYREFNIDFDPCPINLGEITPENDGLLIEWGKCNFVNPPYSRKLKEAFVKRAIEYQAKGRLCVLLIPVSTSTKLFHDYILPNATDIRFLKGRVKFKGICSDGTPSTGAGMHDSMIVVLDGRINNHTNKG